MAFLYTKCQLNRTLTVGAVIRKRKSLQTDGRTDGRMDAKGYNIIRPFFKRAYKKSGSFPLIHSSTAGTTSSSNRKLHPRIFFFKFGNSR